MGCVVGAAVGGRKRCVDGRVVCVWHGVDLLSLHGGISTPGLCCALSRVVMGVEVWCERSVKLPHPCSGIAA